jgi:all-trans-retinol 13,14-reductase
MTASQLDRRELLRLLLLALPYATLQWHRFPQGPGADGSECDAIVVGAGLGGLACAAAFVKRGFRPLVIEQRERVGGYASTFRRGGFEFDFSLHSTTAARGEDGSRHVPGFPELDVEYLPHPNLFRVICPDHDVRAPQQDPEAFLQQLVDAFPDQAEGLQALFADLAGMADDSRRWFQEYPPPPLARIPREFPHIYKHHDQTWGEMMDARIDSPALKTILSAQWGYYALPPSRLASLYYAIPVMDYLREGGYYPRGRSQALSDAFARYIEAGGGRIVLNTRVREITTEGGAVTGVVTADGATHRSSVVVSNVDAMTTVRDLVQDVPGLPRYRRELSAHRPSLSGFQVFLGLKRDLLGELGVTDSEVFFQETYDLDEDFERCRTADVAGCAMTATLFDNIYEDFSPPGKNTLNILVVQGYEPWERFEADYLADRQDAYRAEKQRMADVLIGRLERKLLPGLADAIEVMDVATPLTLARHYGAQRGAMYGFEQVIGNSGHTRVGHATPVEGLFLAGAWTTPGHGYTGVIWSGLECFAEIMTGWKQG